MKKTALIIISLLLVLALLSGCGGTEIATAVVTTQDAEARGIDVSFDEIEYVRPDMELIEAKADEICAALPNPLRFGRINALLDAFYELSSNFDTMYVLCYIRSCQNVRDEFYASEYSWMLEADARMQLISDTLYYACAASPHAFWLEKLKFWEGFREEYANEGQRDEAFYEQYMELAEREAWLLSQYRSMLAEPVIDIAGVEFSFYEYIQQPWAFDTAEAYSRYYEKYNPLLGELYISLISTRNEMAKLMAYDSYAALAYELSYGRDYGPQETEDFIRYVREYIAPLGRELTESGIFYEIEYGPVDEDELLACLETAATELGGRMDEAFSFMAEHGLYDFAYSPNKADISFQTYLADYEAPYLFINPYGDCEDIITVFHEFGHYTDNFIRYNAYESIDLSESFSQAMQFFCLDKLENVLSGEELENLRLMNLLDILNTYMQQTAFAEFELRAYEMEEPTVEKLNELFLQLSKDYGYYDDFNAEAYTYAWSDTPHLFESPFYIISYPVSAGVALQLYELELEEEGRGVDKFIEMSESCLAGLAETLDYADLHDPMLESSVADAATLLKEELEK